MRPWGRTILGVTSAALAACGGSDEPKTTGLPMRTVEVEQPQADAGENGVTAEPELDAFGRKFGAVTLDRVRGGPAPVLQVVQECLLSV